MLTTIERYNWFPTTIYEATSHIFRDTMKIHYHYNKQFFEWDILSEESKKKRIKSQNYFDV